LAPTVAAIARIGSQSLFQFSATAMPVSDFEKGSM
jgi:hypothetical protein